MGNTVQYSIHQCLAELKLLDSKINKVISNLDYNDKFDFIRFKRKGSETLETTGETIEQFKQKANSKLQSIQALIENRNTIKRALVQSNALTKVVIAGIEMSVAEAIEQKSVIEYKKSLLSGLQTEYMKAIKKVDHLNDVIQERLNTTIASLFSKDSSQSSMAQISELTDKFNNEQKYELVNAEIVNFIEQLEHEVLSFENEVDYKLSQSNAVTMVDIVLQ